MNYLNISGRTNIPQLLFPLVKLIDGQTLKEYSIGKSRPIYVERKHKKTGNFETVFNIIDQLCLTKIIV